MSSINWKIYTFAASSISDKQNQMFNVKKTPMVSDEHEKQLKTKSPPLFSYEVASVARSELMQKNNLYDKQDEDDEDGIQQKSSPLLSEQESTYCGINSI